jgi:hypothetical protein
MAGKHFCVYVDAQSVLSDATPGFVNTNQQPELSGPGVMGIPPVYPGGKLDKAYTEGRLAGLAAGVEDQTLNPFGGAGPNFESPQWQAWNKGMTAVNGSTTARMSPTWVVQTGVINPVTPA